jgi:hypothetical protein
MFYAVCPVQIPSLLSEVLYRYLIRIVCRKLGIHSVDMEGGEATLATGEIDQTKWLNVTSSIMKVSQGHRAMVRGIRPLIVGHIVTTRGAYDYYKGT